MERERVKVRVRVRVGRRCEAFNKHIHCKGLSLKGLASNAVAWPDADQV